MFLTNFLLELLDLFDLCSLASLDVLVDLFQRFLEYKYPWYHLWSLKKDYSRCELLKSSILQKLVVRKHFPSVGFESVAEWFESLSAIFSFQVMDLNPFVGDSNTWSFTTFYLKNTLIDSNHFDLDLNHLVQIWVSRWWIRILGYSQLSIWKIYW